MPSISVIVPVYKVEPYLRRCVDSILAQTFTDFELILVDDGSPDNCGRICDEYAQKDSRIHVIHQENGGLSAARNAGLDWMFAGSDSEWITFVDSDDWIHPRTLECLLSAAIENNCAISICGYRKTAGEEPTILEAEMDTQIYKPEAFFIENNVNAITAWGKLYRRECFYRIRYPIGKLHEDEFVTYRILFEYDKVAVLKAPLYYYYSNEQSITNTQWTPAKMDGYTALEEQICYFSDKGMQRIKHELVRRYVLSIGLRSKELDKNASARKLFKKKKQGLFRVYIRELDVKDPKDAWVLTQVFPRRMKLYWNAVALIRKTRMHAKD